MEKKEAPAGGVRYNSLNGLRSFAAVGIVLLHVYANGGYQLGEMAGKTLNSFTELVFLFMIISGFSLCCGYFEKLTSGSISLTEFYAKRYARTWPVFAALVALELLVAPSQEALFEALANLTMCFGLLPNAKIEVIGVGWTLGVIFVFYMVFPFICFLLGSKKRAWLSFGVAWMLHLLCKYYFFNADHMPAGFSSRSNFLFCAMFFLAGGMLWLYRQPLVKLARRCGLLLLIPVVPLGIAYHHLEAFREQICLVMYVVLVVYAMGREEKKGILHNPVTGFISGISMEVYLAHMAVYNILVRLGQKDLFAAPWASFAYMSALTLVGAVVAAVVLRYAVAAAGKLWATLRQKKIKSNQGE